MGPEVDKGRSTENVGSSLSQVEPAKA